jgi:hypothetical protein
MEIACQRGDQHGIESRPCSANPSATQDSSPNRSPAARRDSNPVTRQSRRRVREVNIRGLLATGRTGQAVDLAERFAAGEGPPTPQWRVIERVTTADLLARAGDDRASVGLLSAALSDAETLHLPHQVQRIIRLTDVGGGLRNPTVRMQAEAALTRMDPDWAATHDQTDDCREGRGKVAVGVPMFPAIFSQLPSQLLTH